MASIKELNDMMDININSTYQMIYFLNQIIKFFCMTHVDLIFRRGDYAQWSLIYIIGNCAQTMAHGPYLFRINRTKYNQIFKHIYTLMILISVHSSLPPSCYSPALFAPKPLLLKQITLLMFLHVPKRLHALFLCLLELLQPIETQPINGHAIAI